jgi:hypothetical protein
MPAPMTRWLRACVGAAPMVMVLGCSDARLGDGASIDGQTRIRLSPGEFVGQVPCRRGIEGGLRTYVARLYVVDSTGRIIGADAGTPIVQTSPPAACDRAVVFPALAFQWYGAEISGFDRDVTAEEALTVEPAWRATCGFGASTGENADPARFAPTRIAFRGATVLLRGCTIFGEGLPAGGMGQLEVDVAGALGELRCGQGPGEVSFVEGTLGSVTATARCGQPLVFDVAGPPRYHTVSLTGFEQSGDAGGPAIDPPLPDAAAPIPLADAGQVGDGGADASADDAGGGVIAPPPADAPDAVDMDFVGVPRWSTRCFGQSLPGVSSVAACEPFTPLP